MPYDALLVVSFGGPEKREDVLPFLENVLRGRNVPRERLLEVAEHYYRFGGRSPINEQNRALIAALQDELELHGPRLPIYWGNRNWHPMLADTLREMRDHGVKRALAFVTSAFSSYSGCRQYREDIERAREEAGAGAPEIDKLRGFFNHPGFIETVAEQVEAALRKLPAAEVLFTAHSVPRSMASGGRYVPQLEEACRLVAERVGQPRWKLVYQSRSGPLSQPWLGPDVSDALREIQTGGETKDVVISPIGFVSDHMEVMYDLDTEARELAEELGLRMVRAATPGTHPRFIAMIRELIEERITGAPPCSIGRCDPMPDVCLADCCPAPVAGLRRRNRPFDHSCRVFHES